MSEKPVNFGTSLEERMTPADALRQRITDAIMQSLRVALPGIVQAFRSGPPAVVDVIVASNEYLSQRVGTTGISLETVSAQLPVLQDVPVEIPGAGGWSLTFPIQAGDECLVIFADTPLDVWLQNGGINNNPISQRRHSLSDGVAFFGPRSTPRGVQGYSSSSAQLRSDDGAVVIDLAPDKITITAPNVAVHCTEAASVQAKTATVSATDSVTIGSNVSIDGRSFLLHQHKFVQAGLAASGGVV